MNVCFKVIAAALMAASAPLMAAPASAAPIGSLAAGVLDQAAPATENVQYRRGGGWRGGRGYGGRGVGIGAGFVAGALIGGAIAGSRPYGYGYGPGYGYGAYGPAYVEQDYEDDGYVAVAPSGGSASYCAQRYRSYDPRSGTFLGYDGLRHPCP